MLEFQVRKKKKKKTALCYPSEKTSWSRLVYAG